MNDLAFFVLAFLTIGPGFVEIYCCSRQIKVFMSSQEVPERLRNYLAHETFIHIRDEAFHEEYLRVLKIVVYKIFISSLELCLGLIPAIWDCAEHIGNKSTLFRNHEVIIGIHFTILLVAYDTTKSLVWNYIEDLIFQYYHFKEKYCNLSVMCKTAVNLFFKLFTLIPVGITVVLVGQNAGEYFFFWLWLYFCLIAVIGVTVAWPLCILAILYQIEPFPRGPLWQRIEAIARSMHFPPMEILVAKRNLLTKESSVTTFAGVLCIQRIIISDDFIASVNLYNSLMPLPSNLAPRETTRNKTSPPVILTAKEKNLNENPNPKPLPGRGISFEALPSIAKQNSVESANVDQSKSFKSTFESKHPKRRRSKMSYLRKPLSSRKLNSPLYSYSEKNIEAIVIHELGHWKYSHNVKKLLAVIAGQFFWFAILGRLIYWECLYEAVGFKNNKTPLLAGCVIYTLYISGFFLLAEKLGYNLLCSYHEFEADTLVIEMEYASQMADLLIKRYMKNSIFPIYDKWYSRLYKRFPTLLPRLEFLDRNAQKDTVLPSDSRINEWWYSLT